MSNTLKITVAFVALTFAAPVLAQDATPPPNTSDAAVLIWARDAKISETTANPEAVWRTAGALREGLLFASSAAPDASGVAKVALRLERFTPLGGVRSEVNMMDLDCNKKQLRVTQSLAYTGHNFDGQKTERKTNGAWIPVEKNPYVDAMKEGACRVSGPAVAPIDIQNPEAIRKWVLANDVRDRNVGNQALWAFLNSSTEGVYYNVLLEANPRLRSAVLVVRLERFEPKPTAKLSGALSQTREYEINCRNNFIRQRSTVDFAKRNMQGDLDGVQKVEDWRPIAQDPLLAKPVADFCNQLQQSRDFVAGQGGLHMRENRASSRAQGNGYFQD